MVRYENGKRGYIMGEIELPRCKEGYNGLIPLFCKQCKGSRCNTDEVVLTVPPSDAQELLEVLCSIPQEVEMGEYSDGESHRPPGVDSLIDQLIKYSLESDVDENVAMDWSR